MAQTIEQPETSYGENYGMEATWEGETEDCKYAIYDDELVIYPSVRELYTGDLLPQMINQILNECPLAYVDKIKQINIEL